MCPSTCTHTHTHACTEEVWEFFWSLEWIVLCLLCSNNRYVIQGVHTNEKCSSSWTKPFKVFGNMSDIFKSICNGLRQGRWNGEHIKTRDEEVSLHVLKQWLSWGNSYWSSCFKPVVSETEKCMSGRAILLTLVSTAATEVSEIPLVSCSRRHGLQVMCGYSASGGRTCLQAFQPSLKHESWLFHILPSVLACSALWKYI